MRLPWALYQHVSISFSTQKLYETCVLNDDLELVWSQLLSKTYGVSTCWQRCLRRCLTRLGGISCTLCTSFISWHLGRCLDQWKVFTHFVLQRSRRKGYKVRTKISFFCQKCKFSYGNRLKGVLFDQLYHKRLACKKIIDFINPLCKNFNP